MYGLLFLALATTDPARVVSARHADPAALRVIDTAIARMGDVATLRGIQRVRFDVVVQWLTIRFDGQTHLDGVTYNWNSDLRDYTLNSSRKTRRQSFGFKPGGTWAEFIDVVQDTVGMRRQSDGHTWVPIHTAYVDDQRETFATAPERLLLAARSATDLHLGADTVITGRTYRRAIFSFATLSPHPVTLFVRKADGFAAMTRFRAAQPNDGGLAPYGDMEVEVWWARWQRMPQPAITYPMQWDINRVGQPYQRITTMAMDFNPPATPDSFVVNDSLRQAFLTGPTSRPMWKIVPVESSVFSDGHFMAARPGGGAAYAALIGNQWLLLEGAQTVEGRQIQTDWLAKQVPGSHVGAGVVSAPNGLGVGTGWTIAQGAPVYVAPGAARSVKSIGANWGTTKHGVVPVAGRWIHLGADSAWIEPVDFPSSPGALFVYAPSLKWIYSSGAASPSASEALLALAHKRGWTVDHIGSQTNVYAPITPAARQ